jgi:pimeloyl-ACP methyl ester carboxylesterase
MRARYPDSESFVERDGVKVAYEVFGSGEPTLVFAPTDPLVHSRAWKAQVPYLARTSRVVTIDPRGNGQLPPGRGRRRRPGRRPARRLI